MAVQTVTKMKRRMSLDMTAIRKSAGNLPQISHSVKGRGYVESCEIFTQEQG